MSEKSSTQKCQSGLNTLPKTNSSPLKMVVFNRNFLFQGSIFRCYVSFREGILVLRVRKLCSSVWEVGFVPSDTVSYGRGIFFGDRFAPKT